MTTMEISRIDNQVKALVSRAVFNIFNDPDFGLELSTKAKKRFSSSTQNKKTISLSQIKKKYL